MARKKQSSIPKDYVSTSKMSNGTEKILRKCNQNLCGKEFDATNKYIRTCPECKKKNTTYLERSDIYYHAIAL